MRNALTKSDIGDIIYVIILDNKRLIVNKLVWVGKYNERFNELLDINILQKEIFMSQGLPVHLIKRNHNDCLKYIDRISEIIEHPDYIGVNPNEENASIELVKIFDENILLGIKVDLSTNSLYVSTMYSIHDSKLQRRLHSGRLVKFEE